MIEVTSLADAEALADPVLRREVYGFLSFCLSEFGAEDDREVSFSVLAEEDLPLLADLGPPEETATIVVDDGRTVRSVLRLVYAAEVFFVLGEFADRVPAP